MFFDILSNNLLIGVKNKLLESYCSVTPDEVQAIKIVVDSFVSYYCVKVKVNMFHGFDISYMDNVDQQTFLTGPGTIHNGNIANDEATSTLTLKLI